MWKKSCLAAGIIALLAMPVFAESTTQWMSGYYGLESDADTVGLWHLDDSLADATGNGYDYTFTHQCGYAAGKFNNGMGFPTLQAMTGNPAPADNGDVFGVAGSDQTLECWFYPDGEQVGWATLIYGMSNEGHVLKYDAVPRKGLKDAFGFLGGLRFCFRDVEEKDHGHDTADHRIQDKEGKVAAVSDEPADCGADDPGDVGDNTQDAKTFLAFFFRQQICHHCLAGGSGDIG